MSLYTRKVWCVYIVQLENGSLYTGVTSNLKRRMNQHLSGNGGAKCLRNRPATLVYTSANVYEYKTAVRMEYNLKRKRNRSFKLKLIKSKPFLLDQYLLAK
jgi:putative endonuclease